MKRLKDRVAVVTGAASGIGRATAAALAKKGCHLALSDINEEGLRQTARLVEAQGRKASTHRVDVSDKQQMAAFPEQVVAAHGRVHVVVNNAGVAAVADFKDMSLDDFEWIVGINFWGVVYGCKHFLPYLLKEDEGHLVNISSVFGIIGVPSQSAYCATKFAVRGFSESIRAELDGTSVGVTSVHPGGINTNIVKSSRAGTEADLKRRAQAAKFFEKYTMPPEAAAERIVRGIEKNSPRVLITRETYVIDALKRVFPNFSGGPMEKLSKRMGL